MSNSSYEYFSFHVRWVMIQAIATRPYKYDIADMAGRVCYALQAFNHKEILYMKFGQSIKYHILRLLK